MVRDNRGGALRTGDLFEWTFHTSKGPIDVAAEVVVNGNQLWLKDIAVFGRGSQPLTNLAKDALAARTQLMNLAREMGFEQLRITGVRIPTSTSANPGHIVDILIDLVP